MKLNDTFKVAWWVILLLFVSSLFVLRYSSIAAGTSSTTDVFILLLWIGLMLALVATELNPSGPKLQQSIQSLKDQVQNIYAICSAAIHGEDMSSKQIAYAKEIVLTLKRIQ